jgi:N utilization substance protein B
MSTRRKAREVAFQILYQRDVSSADPQTVLQALPSHFKHFEVPEGAREFAEALVRGTLTELTDIDALIEKTAAHWKLSRMALVDRNLLRMSVYELLKMRETPPSVVIDEAIELGKIFGTAETGPFLNGILDSISKGRTPSSAQT